MLVAAQEHGFVADYSGWRRSMKGTRFKLIDVLLWNVISPGSEDIIGQVIPHPLPSPFFNICHLVDREEL